MAEQRVTQVAAEVIGDFAANERVTQVAAEVIGDFSPQVRTTQVAVDVIGSEVPVVAMNQSVLQAVSHDPVANIRVSQVFISGIYDANGIASSFPNAILNMPAGV